MPKRMSDAEAMDLIDGISRAELRECPRSYFKAVRATLIALGYDEHWVNGRFREMMAEAYVDPKTGKSLDSGGWMITAV